MNISSLSERHNQHLTGNEQYVYDHLLECVKTQSPEQVLDRFRYLFIIAKNYDNQKVLEILAQIIANKKASENFPFILNRCCHILINRWQLQPSTQGYVVELLDLFELLPCGVGKSQARSYSNRMVQLVREFLDTDYFKQLKRLATIASQNLEGKTNPGKKQEVVGNLITRYPYLYDHCLLSVDSSKEQQETVYKVKNQLEKQFESKLSKYVTYQIRVAQAGRQKMAELNADRIIKPANNPTLLSDRDLGKSLKHYIGTVENGHSYKDLSRSFLTHTSDVRNYQLFKDDLYEYVTQSIEGKYGKHSFNKRLYDKLQQMYPKYNYHQPDEFLKMRTYSQLFNYLIVESPNNPSHLVFMDMISNMGTTKTIGLLLKLVLVCSKVKPYLEKRFSILFNHYESFTRDGAAWLVRSLEKVNVAFSVNFGSLDMSFLQRIYAK
ncbi:MAG: hypothetical protein GW795_06395 [Cyanobacteria bacterium]|nr:hypothetical protein [Cyanobacteria bacterium CG_2015-16_32_12]NCO77938.1 hypothetical protein [Cyanobacteria bacterium CG_2015-22_32_23]NCQ05518.1 hypothetical protein [Cyanobacteria bacterium CG_2015-09_32_10]NCQ41515.1 hypothetical protein [Cyanobacteria bacterium CG_2015-04_32_10]NCS83942.1 hypothetical protein [Cyanobacteria bacterium CG_2015-02_32_10]